MTWPSRIASTSREPVYPFKAKPGPRETEGDNGVGVAKPGGQPQ